MNDEDIQNCISSFHDKLQYPHHRYHSWASCFLEFQKALKGEHNANKDTLALQLGFYLVSWGMIRGSAGLLQYTYTKHLETVDIILANADLNLFDPIGKDSSEIDDYYEQIQFIWNDLRTGPYKEEHEKISVTDTLLTKILLGTLGCIPAFDNYFKKTFCREIRGKSTGFHLSKKSLAEICTWANKHSSTLYEMQNIHLIPQNNGRYPIMKLVDVYGFSKSFS